MATRGPMVPGEWYHCFNRGVDKRRVFQSKFDYERFLALMYLCNGTNENAVSDRRDTSLKSILKDSNIDRGESLVEIGAYALMPNHPHFIFKEIRQGGAASFMRKLFTGYTMYFNKKHGRAGALFAGAFKSRHIYNDLYLKRAMAYVLLNPADLFESRWKDGVADIKSLEEKLLSYQYASVADFFGKDRFEGKIVNFSVPEFYDDPPKVRDMLEDARAYYADISVTNTGR